MSQDFIFINPQDIPPRRSFSKKSKQSRKRKQPDYFPIAGEFPSYEAEEFRFALPNEFAGQIILSSAPQEPMSEPEIPFELVSETDPLTDAIFGGAKIEKEPKVTLAVSSERTAIFPVRKSEAEERAEIIAELEKIDMTDAKLMKKMTRLASPSRVGQINIKLESSSNFINSNYQHASPSFPDSKTEPQNFEISSLAEEEELARDTARAENDWFQTNLAGHDGNSKSFSERRFREKSSNQYKLRTILSGLAMLVIPVSLGVLIFRSDDFLGTAIGAVNNKILGTASFTLVNADENSIFPELSDIRTEIVANKSNSEAAMLIINFFEKNPNFSWFNVFGNKASGSGQILLSGLDFLEKARESISSSAGIGVRNLKQSLTNELSFFVFWNQLFLPGKNYLVVMLDESASRPFGGRPLNYAVVKTSENGLETVVSGKFSDLDAAAAIKYIPPRPVQVFSTSWLPSESGWFLDFGESAGTMLNFFEQTTQIKTDGLFAVTKSFLKNTGFKESLIFDVESSNWFYGLSEALSKKPDQRWPSLAKTLQEGLAGHEIQFYFKDGYLNKFSSGRGWQISLGPSLKQDFLGVGLLEFENDSELELIEHKPEIFEDGSVMDKLKLSVKSAVDSSKNYFKIYLPKGAQVLNVQGFSGKESQPEFDYLAKGFISDSRLDKSVASLGKNFKHVDFFEESGFLVVGGWVNLEGQSRKSIELEYLLPFKISRKDSLSEYKLKVIRPSGETSVHFRFVLTPAKNVGLSSLEPNGFVSQDTGEYQANLTQDILLEAGLVFSGSNSQ